MIGTLGRHIEHDNRSRAFPARTRTIVKDVTWLRAAPIFDQGQVGSCTGNAMAGWLGTAALGRNAIVPGADEALALRLYELATTLDSAPGSYPPDDTGSSGLAVAKAARQDGYIAAYRHAFGAEHAVGALMRGPLLLGSDWLQGFDQPGPGGLLTPSGQSRGGHETLLIGLEGAQTPDPVLVGCNSWGASWGDHGHYRMHVSTLDLLLKRGGDITVPEHTSAAKP